ncbi:MAG: FHA domain-containing protein, partial [Varibaculum timonense]
MATKSVQDALAAPCHLQVERGPAAGIVLPLNHSYCRLGRAQLADETVSREHVLFINKSGKIWVRDLGSSNGTFRGRVVSPFTRLRFQQELGASSRIRAGNTVLKVAKRPRVLTVARPRPQLNTASWRQWLFLPMLLFLPLSLA